MTRVSNEERAERFSRWLRTGKLPTARGPDGLELKFNPWHDPVDGRFTFAGAGRRYGAGETAAARTGNTLAGVSRAGASSDAARDTPARPRIEAVTAAYDTLTSNPLKTIRDTGDRIAGIIDTAIAAEDTPARIQVTRAVDAVADASPRELGQAVGRVVGNGALAAIPGAGVARVAALRRLRNARPRKTYHPSQIK